MIFEYYLLAAFILIIAIFIHKHNNHKSLNRFPKGPSGIPYFGYLPFLGQVPCKTISNLSRKWGPIFSLKLGQYTVVFINDLTHAKELYKLDALTGRLQLDLFEKRGKYDIGLLEGQDWLEVRRFMLKSLKDCGLGKKSMEASIQEEVLEIINFLKKNTEQPLYLKPLIEIAVINALWYILTSEKYDIQDPSKRDLAEIMSKGISNQNIVGIASFLPQLAKIFPNISGYNDGLKYFQAPEQLAREVISKHQETFQGTGNERDFIDHAITKIHTTTDPKSMFYKHIGMKNLHYTLIDLFFGGSDTLSSTLSWAFLYLSIWSEKQVQVHQEIDKVVGRSRLPCLEDRDKMPFIEATMAEVLRKSSIVPLGLFHRSLSSIEYQNYTFPQGTIFLTNLYHIFHDPNHWKNPGPDHFHPERFLSPDGKFKKDEHLIPFFIGKRSCPGENLGMIELFLFFTGIMQNFSFSLPSNTPPPDIGPRSGFILPPPKHTVIVSSR